MTKRFLLAQAAVCAYLPVLSTPPVGAAANVAAVWRGDYESGSFNQWHEVQAASHPGYTWAEVGRTSATVVARPRKQGRYAARFVTQPGAPSHAGNERSEVKLSSEQTRAREGADFVYVWSTRFPKQAFWPRYDLGNVFTQFHSVASGCMYPLMLGVDARAPKRPRLYAMVGRLSDCGYARRWDLGPLRFNRWNTFAVRVRWSSNPARGLVQICLNGRRIGRPTPVATLAPGDSAYWKQGFYRSSWHLVNVVYHDGATMLRGGRNAC